MREAGGFRVRGRAASVEACARRTRHVGSIGRGLRASDVALGHRAKRSRPTSGGIGQGLHASDVACAHRAGDVGQPHIAKPTSGVACPHRPWLQRSAEVGRGLPASPFDRTQRSADVGRPSPLDRTQRSPDVGRPSPLDRTQRSADVGRGQPAWAVACTQRSAMDCPHRPWLARRWSATTFPPHVVRASQPSTRGTADSNNWPSRLI